MHADVLALPVASVLAACNRATVDWRIALAERAPRVADTANWLIPRLGAHPGEGDHLVDRLLARLVASAFGRLVRRDDDAWLPAAMLGRVQSVIAAAGLARVSTGDLAKDAGLGVSAFSRGLRESTG